MSEHHHHDSEDNQDQAFIDALYNDLKKTPSPATLDDKVLAAAHQAVAAKPRLVKKRPHWLKPMSAAATVLLVASVSLHQLFDPNVPLDVDAYVSESIYLDDAVFGTRAKSAAKDLAKPELKLKEQVQVNARFKTTLKSETESSPSAKSIVTKKSEKNADLQASQMQPSRFSHTSSEALLTMEAPASPPVSMLEADSAMAEEALLDAESTPITVFLSQDKLRSLNDGQWFYLLEDEQTYWLRYQGHNNIRYAADKADFSLLEPGPFTLGDIVHPQPNVTRE